MTLIGRIARSILDPIADAGEKFLDLKKSNGTSSIKLADLCEDLISHKGIASGIALAREVVNQYNQLDAEQKLAFFQELNIRFRPSLDLIKEAATEFIHNPDEQELKKLKAKLRSKRQTLFSRMNMAPAGTQALLKLREDLFAMLIEHPELAAIDDDLKVLLRTWFNPGFLVLKKINWDTEASLLEKIIKYETVHNIENWNDLKQRLVKDRRCFAYFHPALEDEPLIFVEVALTRGITGSIQEIFTAETKGKNGWDTAIFYSINNCQNGLRQIPLGNFLIKMVVTELASELPSVKTYSTLSPVPGFANWLVSELEKEQSYFISESDKQLLSILNQDPEWFKSEDKSNTLKKPLLNACANYLVGVKKNECPLNPVARFHFGNGAELHRINWMGNTSQHGLEESFGLMVNYLYDLKHIESNHEAYSRTGELAISKSIRKKILSQSD